MKVKCPYCDANQSVLDDFVALPVPCKKCGQPFVAEEAGRSIDVPSTELPSTDAASDQYEADNNLAAATSDISDVDWISDPACVSAGIRRVANSYFSLVVAVVSLAAIVVVGEFNPKLMESPLTWMFLIGAVIVFLISLLLWFNGQVQLRRGHPVGSGLHEAIARSLNMSVMAIVARVFAKILTLPLLKGLGGILSMAAFDRMLLYFELLCIELNDDLLRQRVQALSKFYRRSLSAFIGFLLLYVIVAVPAGAPLIGLYVGLAAFGLSLIFFSVWFGVVLQAVRHAVEFRLNSEISSG